MVLAFHSIFSMYGFWMPNDPRGSGSDYVAQWDLFRYGKATRTDERVSVAHFQHDRAYRLAAKSALKYPPVKITGLQAVSIAHGFAQAIEQGGYQAFALAILPEHVHVVIGRHHRSIRRIVGHWKSKATMELKNHNQWHSDNRPLWGEHGWNVFLSSDLAVERAIRYVEQNPVKEGKRIQRWNFVSTWQG